MRREHKEAERERGRGGATRLHTTTGMLEYRHRCSIPVLSCFTRCKGKMLKEGMLPMPCQHKNERKTRKSENAVVGVWHAAMHSR